MGKVDKAKRDCLNRVHSDQMVLRTVRQEAGPRKRRPKVLKTKLAQGGPSGLSLLVSDTSCDGQAGSQTTLTVPKKLKERVTATLCTEELFLRTQNI